MKDPLNLDGQAQELFLRIWRELETAPVPVIHNIAMNILMNVIRMTTPYRKDAEAQLDDALGRAKSLLLAHYDSTTGQRKTLFPYTQMAQAPFHQNKSEFFPPGG